MKEFLKRMWEIEVEKFNFAMDYWYLWLGLIALVVIYIIFNNK